MATASKPSVISGGCSAPIPYSNSTFFPSTTGEQTTTRFVLGCFECRECGFRGSTLFFKSGCICLECHQKAHPTPKHRCIEAWFDSNGKQEGIRICFNRYGRGLTKMLQRDVFGTLNAQEAIRASNSSPFLLTTLQPRIKQGTSQAIYAERFLTQVMIKQSFPYETSKLHQTTPFILHPLVSFFNDRKWRIVSSQLCLGCCCHKLATRVDLVVRDQWNRIILLELKFFFNSYFYVENQKTMQEPFQDLQESYFHRAVIQLWFTTWLFFHCQHPFQKHAFGGSFIIRLFFDSNRRPKLDFQPIPFWFLKQFTRSCHDILHQWCTTISPRRPIKRKTPDDHGEISTPKLAKRIHVSQNKS